MAGLDSTGYTAKDLDEVLSDLRSAVRGRLGEDVNLTSSSVLGTLIGIFAEGVADAWKSTQALYDAFNRDNASGIALDNLALLIGLQRREAIASTGFVTLVGTGTPFVPAGSLMETSGGDRVQTTEDANVGDTGVPVEALEDGPIELSGGLTPVTVISGWTGVTVTSTFLGRDVETDGELRVRMQEAPEVIGRGTVEAIRADLLRQLPEAISILVIENRQDVTDSLGLPPHSFRAYLYPPTLDVGAIGRSIWQSKPAGIATSGSVLSNVTDTMGFIQAMRFEWATQFELEWRVTITAGVGYPGDAAIRTSVLEYSATLEVNEIVKPFACLCHILDEHGEDAFDAIVVEVRQKGVGAYQEAPLGVDPFTIGVVADPGDVTVIS